VSSTLVALPSSNWARTAIRRAWGSVTSFTSADVSGDTPGTATGARRVAVVQEIASNALQYAASPCSNTSWGP
jgi:hypothetical protein